MNAKIHIEIYEGLINNVSVDPEHADDIDILITEVDHDLESELRRPLDADDIEILQEATSYPTYSHVVLTREDEDKYF